MIICYEAFTFLKRIDAVIKGNRGLVTQVNKEAAKIAKSFELDDRIDNDYM